MNKLEAARKRLKLTQADMAEALGLSLRAYQEQEASTEPRKAYVLAVRSLEPLSQFEEQTAQALASRYVAVAALRVIDDIATKLEMGDVLNKEADKLRDPELTEFLFSDSPRIERRACDIAANILETVQFCG